MASQMRAILTSKPGPAAQVLSLATVPVPALESAYDILVKIRGVALNPVDTKVRSSNTRPNRILGYDAAGLVEQAGEKALFKKGDEVMYAGAVARDGTNAQYGVVDSRIVGRKPKGWSWEDAAGLPLVGLTAWEMLEEQFGLKPFEKQTKEHTLLIVNGAGGVGSMATQLAARIFNVKNIIVTASRQETIDWAKKNGATHVINHREDIAAQLKDLSLKPTLAFICHDTLKYLPILVPVMRPFGRIGSIVGAPEPIPFQAGPGGAFSKALSFHWEYMFAKSAEDYEQESQGRILNLLADAAEEGKVGNLTTVKEVLSLASLKRGHELLESGKAIGKIVFEVRDTIEEN
ncbi:zinc-binding alcohol dehydrogenase [Gloeophyllum trabeum ATCC 11539]|uniref:Zinc-binding alcohol dehydrogenase n=1 Tax=Gloeophyllum trabeum (strain ATCC 11539 / FP-39264 / Madison 617) TaxID=670483 RepID=S7QKH8_GLOTA|nr:zinc-binding alcohol dehydrogenase [Gloeophyllum trabeum ATCC 11539]EPQ60266.1 zinc-binding alcohol dehydrogenase [Gloeophyllum trabeum ATCC 11539]